MLAIFRAVKCPYSLALLTLGASGGSKQYIVSDLDGVSSPIEESFRLEFSENLQIHPRKPWLAVRRLCRHLVLRTPRRHHRHLVRQGNRMTERNFHIPCGTIVQRAGSKVLQKRNHVIRGVVGSSSTRFRIYRRLRGVYNIEELGGRSSLTKLHKVG